jgi:hypothetical protein
MVEKRNAYRILVGKPEGKRLLGRPRRRWVDNIKMKLQGVGCEGTGFIWLKIGSLGRLLRRAKKKRCGLYKMRNIILAS